MDPLITNGVDPALLRVLEKRGEQRDVIPRRKRPSLPKTDEEIEENSQDPDEDSPPHTLDDLA